MFIADNARTRVDLDGRTGVAAGWLPDAGGFTTGSAPEGFLEKLDALCADRSTVKRQTRGFHACPFCPGGMRMNATSSAELWIDAELEGEAVTYQMPRLVAHYVREHQYLPPQELVSAVLAL